MYLAHVLTILRSACYSSLQNWNSALQDAKMCISLDENFIKGYFRLATAQTEQEMFDDAIITLNQALAKEPGM